MITQTLSRPRLSEQLHLNAHILISGPTGYGKTVLLEQFSLEKGLRVIACRSSDTVSELLSRAELNPVGQEQILILDDAYLLPTVVVDELLSLDPRQVRLVMAVRHTYYSRIPLLLLRRRVHLVDAPQLTFSQQELSALGMAENRVEDIFARTLGWPYLSVLESRPFINSTDLLEALYDDLPEHLKTVVDSVAPMDGWILQVVLDPKVGTLAELLNTGFPIIQESGVLEIHPLMRQVVLEKSGQHEQDIDREQNVILEQLLADTSPVTSRVRHIQTFFDQRGDDDQNIEKKVQLLGSLPLEHLTPRLRDIYAYYLLCILDSQKAEGVLMFQQETGTASTRTYSFLARIASRRNQLNRYREMLKHAKEAVQNEEDWARYHVSEAYYHVRLNDFDSALASAEASYVAATRAGNIELHILALQTVGNIHQLRGNIPGAIQASREALTLSESQGHKFVRLTALLHNHLGEMTKDMGWREEALSHVQNGLTLQLVAAHPEVPSLYATRGLIYLEMGLYEQALQSLQTSLEIFEADKNAAGALLPRTFIVYILYRLGWHEAIYKHLSVMRQFEEAYPVADVTEHRSFRPLAEGIWHLTLNDRVAAITALRETSLDGALTYDSVLVAHLLLGQLLIEEGQFTPEDAQTLITILDARHSEDDATARAYADEFQNLFSHIAALGIQPARFERLAGGQADTGVQRPQNVIILRTMGQLTLTFNNQEMKSRGKNPLRVFAYLLYARRWITADQIGMQLFRDLKDSHQTAIQAIAVLRGMLLAVDQELEGILSARNDSRGYRYIEQSTISVRADFLDYLELFRPENPNSEMLLEMLGNFHPFLSASDSDFAVEINEILNDRVVEVVSTLARQHLENQEYVAAAKVLLMGLRLVNDPGLMEIYSQEVKSHLSPDAGGRIQQDELDDDRFNASVEAALVSLGQQDKL